MAAASTAGRAWTIPRIDSIKITSAPAAVKDRDLIAPLLQEFVSRRHSRWIPAGWETIGWRDRAPDEGGRRDGIAGLAGNFDGPPRVLLHLVCEARMRELTAVGVVTVGGDQIGSRPPVVFVDLTQNLRRIFHGRRGPSSGAPLGRCAFRDIDAPSMKLRSGAAVQQNCVALLQAGHDVVILHFCVLL